MKRRLKPWVEKTLIIIEFIMMAIVDSLCNTSNDMMLIISCALIAVCIAIVILKYGKILKRLFED